MSARETYNVFARGDGAQFCAVRQDHPIPGFLDAARWDYLRSVEVERDAPPGFDADEAADATRRHGFYLFRRRATAPDARPSDGYRDAARARPADALALV